MSDRAELDWPERFERNTYAVEMYADGKTLRDIGEELKLSHVAVLRILDGAGIKRRNKHTRVTARTVEGRLALLDARYQRAREKILGTTEARTDK